MQLCFEQKKDVVSGEDPDKHAPYRVFFLLSCLFHFSMFFLIQHGAVFLNPLVGKTVDLIELVGPEALEPRVSLKSTRDAILFRTKSPAELEAVPRGEKTRLPSIPETLRSRGSLRPGPKGADHRKQGGTLLQQTQSSFVASPQEELAGVSSLVELQKKSMREGPGSSVALTSFGKDRLFETKEVPDVVLRGEHPGGGNPPMSSPASPSDDPLRGGGALTSSRLSSSGLFSGSVPGLPFLDGENLDRLARGFTETKDVSRDPVTIKADDLKYFSYLLKLKNQIGNSWSYPLEAEDVGLEGDLLVRFTVQRDGALRGVDIVSSSGYDLLDIEAIRAVEAAAPYPPLPKAWIETALTVTGHFIYENNVITLR